MFVYTCSTENLGTSDLGIVMRHHVARGASFLINAGAACLTPAASCT